MANAWYTGDVRVTVPETVRFVLTGELRRTVTAKDVMLHVLSLPFFRSGQGIGKVLEFAGRGLGGMGIDERSTLTNMAVEGGCFTGILEADDVVVGYLVRQRGLTAEAVQRMRVVADPGASYAATFELDLAAVVPMVATPGNPRNGVPLAELRRGTGGGDVKIDIAYGGSCTGGKRADMDMYASVLARARRPGPARRGRRAPGDPVRLPGRAPLRRGEGIRTRSSPGRVPEILGPSCGACIKAGPGVSDSPDQVTVSSQSRNFPGRSGPGKVYLASPLVVAASAIAGKLVGPEDLA